MGEAMMTSLAKGVVYRSERDCIDDVDAAFHAALAIAWGGAEVEIVREGAVKLGELSACERLTIIVEVGAARARAATLITVAVTSSPTMGKSTSAAEDYPPIEPEVEDLSTEWVWVLVRGDRSRGESVWVRYPVNEAPEGLAARPAQPPSPGSLGVVVMHVPEPGHADLEEFGDAPRRGRTRRRRATASNDRNLVTIAEFATALDVAESTVFEWLKRGLPSVKTKGLGRRILRKEAEAWLMNGGAERSPAAKKLAKARDRANGAHVNGATRG